MDTTAKQLSLKEVFQLRPIRRLWMAQAISLFGYLRIPQQLKAPETPIIA